MFALFLFALTNRVPDYCTLDSIENSYARRQKDSEKVKRREVETVEQEDHED